MRHLNPGWDALDPNRPDKLLEVKRTAEQAIGERVGWEPDWKLQQIMLREKREEEFSDMRSREMQQRIQRPDWSPKISAWMKKAWEDGKFSQRKQGYAKRTPERLARAQRLRAEGLTYDEIGKAIGVTAYTAMKWLGWTRKAKATNRFPVTFEGVTYPSLRAAERATGVHREAIKRRAT